MRALVSLSVGILVSLPLCLKLENFIIYVSLCNSRIRVITLYSGHVCVYYVSMLWCWYLIWILVRTDHPFLGVGCHTNVMCFESHLVAGLGILPSKFLAAIMSYLGCKLIHFNPNAIFALSCFTMLCE
jgi:hypothetical protein